MAIPSASKLIVAPIGIPLADLRKPLRWKEIFSTEQPIELEIGFGKGNFLTSRAKAHPEKNFFGVEWAAPLWRYTSDRLRRNGCDNARTVRAEAGEFLRDFVPANSLEAIHVYFPDPWPKRRHHKRRLIQKPFLQEVHRTLRPGGEFRFATDHRHYFEQVEALLAEFPKLPRIPFAPDGLAERDEMVGSNFERIFRRQGTPTLYLAARKS